MTDTPSDTKAPTSGEGLEYDFYRFYMLIALLVLSGTITLAASPAADRVTAWIPIVGAVLSVTGATIAFVCQVEMVRIASGQQDRRTVTRYGIGLLSGLFVIAMAMFLLVAFQLA